MKTWVKENEFVVMKVRKDVREDEQVYVTRNYKRQNLSRKGKNKSMNFSVFQDGVEEDVCKIEGCEDAYVGMK